MEQDEHLLHSAFQTAYSHQGLALSGPKDPGFIARSLASEQNNPLKMVNDFVSQNSDLLGSRLKSAGGDVDFKSLEDSVNGFAEVAKTTVKGLQALGHLHPFIGVAVGAFALVVTMDFTRRDNDRKVLAVKVQMQELMMIFFELRHVRDSHDKGHDGVSIANRLKTFMIEVASDIKKCGSACDTYLKKGFLARTVKATVYEARLAEFAQRFVDHRSTLELALSLHTTIGVDSANEKLDDQEQILKGIDRKLDMMMVFRHLDTPRERDVQKFIEEHGGVKACINNDEYLEELVAKSGDSLSRISGRSVGPGRRSNDLPEIRKRLMKEVREDIDEALSRNMVLFERKLDMQNKQLNETLRQESDHIITALMAGAHDRINDPDLRKLWKEMGWRGSVKARTFVLNLHDYYADQHNRVSDSPTVDRSSLRSSIISPASARVSPIPSPRGRPDDHWALSYINAAYVQSILEAVDDDGTGFISIKEVNTFIEERPVGWSLPEWFAYWAVGWQISITQYKSKIYGLVQSMFEMLDHVLPSNRRGVDEYLFHPSFWRIELILRSTRSVNPKMLNDSDLVRYTEMYTAEEESRLEMNLEDVGYELDTTATVSLVTGEGRIERFVYPLIYLLLKRHLRVLTLASKHVLDPEEFITLNESLVSVLLAVDARIQNLEAVFKQTHFDIQARLGNFAFGLLQLSYGDIRRVPAQITFGTWGEAEDVTPCPREAVTKETIQATLSNTSHEILKYGHRDGYQSTDYFEFEPQRKGYLGPPHPLEGTWSGHNLLMAGEDTVTYILRISILVHNGQQIVGKGEHFTGAFEFSGHVRPLHPGRRSKYDFSFALTDDEDGLQKECYGQLDVKTGILHAQWTDRRINEDPSNIAYQPFELTKTPPSLTRYRYTNEALVEDPVRARWSFACAAARHMAQEKMWSRGFLEERATERKRYVELSIRSLIVTMGLTPQKPLSAAEKGELDRLRRNLNPSEARFYQALADFEIQKLPWHPAWGCDWCERRITKARNLCITCMSSEDLSDNIDLCSACVDRAPSKRGFVHDPSHIMVKVEETLHDFYFIRVVENAKVTIEKMKNLFRVLEANALHPEENADSEGEDRHRVVCACCAKQVTTPCWACVICSRDTFVCNECDTNRTPPLQNGPSSHHQLSHPLVRIRDTSLSGQTVTTEERLNALEQRLIMMEHKVSEGFAAVDEKFERLESRVEERLTKLETYAVERFDTMEAVLRQIMAQTMALPAIYGQVVRDTMRHSMPANFYHR
ncbi:hypothetical protein P691DRAFT_712505 [Macrolepiota fuliginosa MF-IS2]|uniref:EF-hand domain-containing protein n=1 Tax=Macrolepiota fuliginosa MF-IS2 TaxID=1400762 RepID=A0A9P6BYA9_9AGAR|nr:hypothetical protein P691DRAFT_712505 [Macrolepiota fuliginosa MF-IS2]